MFIFDEEKRDSMHEKMLYPVVRVSGEKGVGSGTIIYSKLIKEGSKTYETYVLTNHHVVNDNIKVESQWSMLLQREAKTDILSECQVEIFDFEYGSWESGAQIYKADIVAYHTNMDLALLKLKTSKKIDYVATLFPKGAEKEKLRMFMPLMAVGCGLGHPPLITFGLLTGFTDMYQNYNYWLSSSPIIFGNSGGAVFLAETEEFVGVPAMVGVHLTWTGQQAVPHMSFVIPITNVYRFLDEQVFQFIYDSNYTSEQCSIIRSKKRDADIKNRKDEKEEPKDEYKGSGWYPELEKKEEEDERFKMIN
jgi:S1-C subfamily serine protease